MPLETIHPRPTLLSHRGAVFVCCPARADLHPFPAPVVLGLNENGSSAHHDPLFGIASPLCMYPVRFNVSGSHRPPSTALSCQGMWGEVASEVHEEAMTGPQEPLWAGACCRAQPERLPLPKQAHPWAWDSGLAHILPPCRQALPDAWGWGCPRLPPACPASLAGAAGQAMPDRPFPDGRPGSPCGSRLTRRN